ncbi:MAG: SusD/RagB family nutrient-binding outer membrane lipoprotein [Cytophagia bacterium]|nr:SusD/RagB family nutrient-binding outer membrane lipoprotein [Cytophagia bacterium]
MIKAYKKTLLVIMIIMASSCTLDLREDPNAVQVEQVLPSLILNSIQRSLPGVFNAANTSGGQMTRLLNGGGQLYLNATTPQDFNGLWSAAYADVLGDINTLLETADANGFARHAGMARVMQAYTLVLLVDMFGDVPFSEAFQGASNFNPKADPGAEIYARAIQILDKAKQDLTTPATTALTPGYLNPVAPAIQDQYYNNDYTKWIKLANTIKLKIYVNLRLTQPAEATTAINALIAEPAPTGGFITAANENFIWRYGTSLSDPAARHPRFVAQYPGGGGDYQSNWLMWHMFHAYNAVNTTTAGVAFGDPRMRFYFNRQVTANSSSTNELRCLGESRPDHFPSSSGAAIVPNALAGVPPMGVAPTHPSMDPTNAAWGRTFCTPANVGYWGRDHVDPQGIPPDGLLRTAYGPYPVGGRFDNNHGTSVAQTQGMQGAGIQPMLMRSYVQFLLAESALYLGTTGLATARVHFENGIAYSFADVRNWSVNGTLGTSALGASPVEAVINTFYPLANYNADVANYTASALAAFDNRLAVSNDEAMNYVARECWVSLFGNGYEAYNLYRRTGKPTGMQPAINPTPGNFPRSFWYPANFANINNSVDQKADLTTRVFWDNTTFNLDF